MKQIAVVGANGFLGRQLVASLIEIGYDVTSIYNRKTNGIVNSKKLRFDQFLKQDQYFDCILYAAGGFSSSYSEMISINCKQLLQIAEKYDHAHIQYISSVNVYGVHKGKIREEASFNSPSLYGRAKLCGEFIVASCAKHSIVRLTYIYGPGLNNGSFLPNIISKAQSEREITLMGRGERIQDYIYVEDAVELCIRAFEAGVNDIYLGATGESISNLEVAKYISQAVPSRIQFVGVEKGQSYEFDPSETFRKLDWHPQIKFEDGIRNMLK